MNKVVVTAFNSKYFECGRTLIFSVLKYGYSFVNEIHVYNLGLSEREIKRLTKLKKVKIYSIPEPIYKNFPHFKNPKNFAWKTYIINNEANLNNDFLYIDAGICFVNECKIAFEIIDTKEILLVNDIYQTNNKWCHNKCFKILNATVEEKKAYQICAGIQGYKHNGRFNNLPGKAFKYAQIADCIDGDIKDHRHDQCIYSVLSTRINCPRQDIHIYGEWQGIMSEKQVLYVHRGKYKINARKAYYNSLLDFFIESFNFYKDKLNINKQ